MGRPKTNLSGSGLKTIANGAPAVKLPGSDDSSQFIVTNLNTNTGENLYIGGADQVPALVAFPGLPITLPDDCELWLTNTSGVTISYIVGRVYKVGGTQAGGRQAGPGGQAGGGSGGSGGDGGGRSGGGVGGQYTP